MAATKPATADALTRKLGPLPIWAWAGIGVALALFWTKKSAGSSSNSSSGQSGSPFGYSLASQQQAAGQAAGAYGSRYPIGYSDYSSGADLAGVLSQLSSQVSMLAAGNSGTNQSPAPAPGSTQTGASNQTNPAPPVINVPGLGPSYVLGPTGNPNDYQVYGGVAPWYGYAIPNGVGQGQTAYQKTLGTGWEYIPTSSVSPSQIYGGPTKIPAPGPV